MNKKGVVIGGGFAGLSASVALASAGYHVTLIEQRRYLGGRAYSFLDRNIHLELDNGQHILMGCHENTFRFLKTIGTIDRLYTQDNLHVDFLDAKGHAYRLKCPSWPAPLHATSGILRFNALSLSERFKMLKVTKDVLLEKRINPSLDCTGDCTGDCSVSEWLERLGQGRESRGTFWDILTYAVMNEEPDRASASLFKTVLRMAFLTDRKGSRIVIPAVPLSRLFAGHAEDYIKNHGGIIEKGCLASEILIDKREGGSRVSGIRLQDGKVLEGDFYISAVPYYSLKRLLSQDVMMKYSSCFNGISQMKPSPIISIHLLFDKSITNNPFAAFINSPIQWIFNKEMIYKDKAYRGLFSIVISGAHSYLQWSSEKLLEMAMAELGKILPETNSARLLYSRIIKERAATFSPKPGIDKYRLPQKTPMSNLFLAGDWTDTGLPATIEGAVLSGYRCAEMIKEE